VLLERKTLIVSTLLLISIAGCNAKERPTEVTTTDDDASVTPAKIVVDPSNWPQQATTMVRDPEMEEQIADLMQRMTLEEKVGQIVQADISAVTPSQVRDFNLGSILNGGGSAPGGDNRTTPDKWLALADEFWDASTDTSDGGVGIPTMWGTDAVHGNSNVLGATLFPHNIGLGMADDPDLIYEIGMVTALEILATGLDWTFAPTIAVARNDRWGRTYESYSEDSRIVASYAPRIVEGIQGVLGSDDFLGDDHLLATAKHFAGDGGTTNGIDQGDTAISEADLRDIHAAGYAPAIAAGVQTIMASFSSFHGRKMHGYEEMLNGVLVDRMGFDGFVVGDWNGHGQVAGCSNTSCAASLNAGLDMFMAPNSWEGVYKSTLHQIQSGEISMQRLDEAVGRVLRVKMRAGLFSAGRPSSRKYAGNFALLGAEDHRAVARDAVRKSLVLLKNEQQLLPLQPGLTVLVAGEGADNIGKQSGGWTLNWQGTDNLREHFPHGESIFDGIREAVAAGGGTAVLSKDGEFSERPDVAIVVFGEDPYAEGVGDRPHVDYDNDDGLILLGEFHDLGIPTVSVFISGRPLWVNPELNLSNAFVAAWLPGSEGAGVADVLVANDDGAPRFDFTGKLSFSWPKYATQAELNVGDEDYDPLFPYGFGLRYADDVSLGDLRENSGLASAASNTAGDLIAFGDAAENWTILLRDAGGDTQPNDGRGESTTGSLQIQPADRDVQEDSAILTWSGAGSLVLSGPTVDLALASDEGLALAMNYQVISAGATTVSLGMGSGAIDITSSINENNGRGWQRSLVKLSCFREQGASMESIDEPLRIAADGPLILQLSSVRVVANLGDAGCE